MQISYQKAGNFQLWETKVENEPQEFETTLVSYLSASELVRLANISHENKKREYIYSRWLMRHAFSQVFNLPNDYWSITDHPNALPIITNLPFPMKYSLSHSKKGINFVASNYPVGIDIEKQIHKKNLVPMAKLFMSDTEYDFFLSTNLLEKKRFFYQVWCIKEAFFKALDLEAQKSFKANNISVSDIQSDQSDWEIIDLSCTNFSRIIVLKVN